MKKINFLKSWLMLCLLLVGIGSAWAADQTVTWTVTGVNTSANGAAVNTTLKVTKNPTSETGIWTAVSSANSFAGTNSGAQLGSSSYSFNGTIILSGTSIPSNATIKKVVLTCRSGGSYTISVKVGSSQLGSSTTINNTTAADKTFSGSLTGNNIVIELSTSAKKYFAVSKIAVTYASDGGSDEQYSYTLATIGNGTTTFKDASNNVIAPNQEVNSGTKLTPTFTPNPGYEFTSWEYLTGVGNWSSLSYPGTFTITKNVQFRVTFSETQSGGNEPGDGGSGESGDPSVDGYTHDVLTSSDLAATGTSYTDFSGVSKKTAVYAGNSALNNGISLRTNNSNSGIVSTTSGGKIKTVTVAWNSATTSSRTIDVYGSNTAYTQATDLYATATRGTKLGSIVYGTSTSLAVTGEYAYVGVRSNSSALMIDNIDFAWEEEGTKALTSISVKTAPTKVVYTEEEMFNPAGLVITATYDDESTEDITYAGNESKFTFGPSLTTALQTTDENVQITYGGKPCNQAITVNAIPTYTLTITQPTEGGTLTVKNGDATLTTGATVRVGTNLTCEVTNIPEGKRFSRFYAKWGEGDGESKYKATNPATFDNIATENITACEIYVTYKDIQYYTINYMINGVNTNPQENLEEKSALIFPTAPSAIEGKYFIGWVENEIDGTVDEEPVLVNTSELTATANKTYYAVYAAQGEGGAATYTKATSLAVGDKVVFGLGETNGKPAQAVTGANSSATISATESEWIVYTAVNYPDKGIVLQLSNGNYQRTAKGSFDFTSDNPSTMSTNASSHVIGFGSFVLYNTPSNGNKFYSSKGDGYVEFLMWKVEGGISYTDYCTAIQKTATLSFAEPTYYVIEGENFTAPELNNPQSVTVAYASSETGVATVNQESGAVSLVAPGTTTITASFDGSKYYTEASASYTLIVLPATVSVTTNTLGYATFAPSMKVAIPEEDGLKVYYVVANDGTSVSTEDASGVVEAGTGLIIKTDEPSTQVIFAATNESAAELSRNLLKGVLVNTAYDETAHANAYLFSKGSNGVGFYKWMTGTLAAGKAYLDLRGAASAPQFIRFVENGSTIATSLEDILNEEATAIKFLQNGVLYIRKGDHIYNANGQMVK